MESGGRPRTDLPPGLDYALHELEPLSLEYRPRTDSKPYLFPYALHMRLNPQLVSTPHASYRARVIASRAHSPRRPRGQGGREACRARCEGEPRHGSHPTRRPSHSPIAISTHVAQPTLTQCPPFWPCPVASSVGVCVGVVVRVRRVRWRADGPRAITEAHAAPRRSSRRLISGGCRRRIWRRREAMARGRMRGRPCQNHAVPRRSPSSACASAVEVHQPARPRCACGLLYSAAAAWPAARTGLAVSVCVCCESAVPPAEVHDCFVLRAGRRCQPPPKQLLRVKLQAEHRLITMCDACTGMRAWARFRTGQRSKTRLHGLQQRGRS